MNRLNLHPSSLSHPAEARVDVSVFPQQTLNASLEERQRLLVLIPGDIEYSAMTRGIWELANATGAHVQLLSLCKEATEEPGLRRCLAMMSALIQEAGVFVDAKVETGSNWVDLIKRYYEGGDLIVCFAEQRAGFLQRPLSQILQTNLNVPVYRLSGLASKDEPRPSWFSQILAWAGSLGIIIGSFLLQIRITSLPHDWAQTTLLIFSVLGEIWLIWSWNNLFG